MYEYHWLPSTLVQPELVADFSALYSRHYGVWGSCGPHPGEAVRLSSERIQDLLVEDSIVVWATAFGNLVGYAIAVQTTVAGIGKFSWVTQLVVHAEHRKQDVGKTLLFTIWRFTNYFAWGLISANPYAIRALEKATRRRCQPQRIAKSLKALVGLAAKVVPYVDVSTEILVNSAESRVNTKFFLDHSQLPAMLAASTAEEKPWTLGPLPEGWEWLAFTFQDQNQISLSNRELHEMLDASDTLTKYAYSRMISGQPWALYTDAEVEFIIQNCQLKPGNSIIDFGCGEGRLTIGLAIKGMIATGIDYVADFIDTARSNAAGQAAYGATFEMADCRTVDFGTKFDAGICVYDVIGSHAEENENIALFKNLVKQVKAGGFILISVMNMELTERCAQNWFSAESEADRLLSLKPSQTMEKTGNVFNPEFYLIDRNTKIVYRKEQFTQGEGLPEELIIRDRRYTEHQIRELCTAVGLEICWSRLVRSGGWDEPLARESDKAKEILVLSRKGTLEIIDLFDELNWNR